jgi:hypothetical protein
MKRPNANKNAAKPNSIMSHYVTIPIGSNGVIDPDEQIQDIITKSMSLAFSPTDIFIYSHGWWTTADAALKEYNTATTDLIYFLRTKGHPLSTATSAPFPIGIRWPSIVDDDPSSPGLLVPILNRRHTWLQKRKRPLYSKRVIRKRFCHFQPLPITRPVM